jgi:outer membrane biogenesis lipoprotein LolB
MKTLYPTRHKLLLYPLGLLLLTGCAVKETHLQPINDALSKQQQYLLAVINAHNTLATCIKDNDTVKAIKACVAKAYEKKEVKKP